MKILWLTILVLSYQKALAVELGVGQPLPPAAIKKNMVMLITPSQFAEVYILNSNGLEYEIGVYTDKKIICYLSVRSEEFNTPENVSVGVSYADLIKLGYSKINIERGWAHYVSLPSGWKAAFCLGDSCTTEKVKPESRVLWLFKR